MSDKLDGLIARLHETSVFFDSRVSLIPPAVYFRRKPEEEVEMADKFFKNKKEKAPKQETKEATKAAKRARLDPAISDTVVDVQAAISAATNEKKGIEEGSAELAPGLEPAFQPPSSQLVLKQRLLDRIQLLQRKRKADDVTRATLAKVNSKGKKKKAKLESLKKKESKVAAQLNADDRAEYKTLSKTSGGAADSTGAPIFSKFDFSTAERVDKKKKKGASTPMQLLAKAQAEEERLAELKKIDSAKARQQQEKAQWQAAMQRADGVKVKDDPKLLKKTIKRREAAKNRTKKEWGERVATVVKKEKEHQTKRKEQLKVRAMAKVERKKNRQSTVKGLKEQKKKALASKGKKRPGFEGGGKAGKGAVKEKMTLQTGYKKKKNGSIVR